MHQLEKGKRGNRREARVKQEEEKEEEKEVLVVVDEEEKKEHEGESQRRVKRGCFTLAAWPSSLPRSLMPRQVCW